MDAVDVVGADGYGPLWGLPYIEAAHPGGDHDGDSSAPGRLVCQRPFSFGRPDTAVPRSAPEIERFAGLSAACGSAAQTRNDEPKPVGKT